jgi:hypothetical protein
MDAQFKKWFIAERGKVLAKILLTRRADLVINEAKEQTGLDFTVSVQRKKESWQRPFGVLVHATMAPVAIPKANEQLKPVLASARSLGPFNYPVVVFFFMMKGDQRYYTWASEPVVTDDDQPRLKSHAAADCKPLDNEALEAIVSAVKKWYDALLATLTS